MTNKEFVVWVVYVKGLAPYPTKHIARKHIFAKGKSLATLEIETGATLEEVRMIMNRRGLVCIDRDIDDDPVIIETWI